MQALFSMLKESFPPVLIVDLDALGARIGEFGGLAREKPCTNIGYYSHVNVQLAEEARRVGSDVILPRGPFMARMEETLRKISVEGRS